MVGKCLVREMSKVWKCLGRETSWYGNVLVGKCIGRGMSEVGKRLDGRTSEKGFLVGKCLVGKRLVGKCPGTFKWDFVKTELSLKMCRTIVCCLLVRSFG